ncbi:MAG TPA: phosphodiester glycosidase family protein [Streptosporangiaceae bacterium]|nr:phosphodiester glycosidase family protein [Streptosporangiaceae bacterium]
MAGRPHRSRHLAFRVILAIITTIVFVAGWSLGRALTVPGGGTVPERVAEWARSHYLGPVVTFGEWLTYRPPVKGGSPNISFTKLGGKTVHTTIKKHHGRVPVIPANLGSMAGRPLAGEGQWREVEAVHGIPAVFKTYIRFSKVYSSYYAGVVSLDERLVKFSLRPGTQDPAPGHWGAPDYIPPGHRVGLIATFNSGFRINASGGGFYLHGHYDGKLVKGVASEVYFRDGRLAIGSWGSGRLHMGPDIAAVRQNLHLIVTGGKVPKAVDQGVNSTWGATLGGKYYVWRSGIGVTGDGRVIFAYGPSLNVRELAEVLKRAGAVSAMELDINPDWMSFMYYLAKNHPRDPKPVNLLPSQVQPPDRYYYPANRDFTAVFAR